MPSGFSIRSKGKIQASELWLGTGGISGTGGIVDSVSGIAAFPVVSQSINLPVTAATNTDFSTSVPAGTSIVRLTVYTTTAYGASTDAKIQLGSTLGGVDYVAAVTIKALGIHALTLVAAGLANLMNMPSGSPNLFARIVQTGTLSATGAATLVVEYT